MGKEAYEDLDAVLAGCATPGAREALERLVRRTLRALATPQGHTAKGMIHGLSVWQGVRVPLRDPEADK